MLDIVELLEDCVKQSAEYGVPKDSLKSKLMIEAAEEIKRLRKEAEFFRKQAGNYDALRLQLINVIGNCRDLYEETCKQVREKHTDDSVCSVCFEACAHGLDEFTKECSGAERADCFRLDINEFYRIVFRKDKFLRRRYNTKL